MSVITYCPSCSHVTEKCVCNQEEPLPLPVAIEQDSSPLVSTLSFNDLFIAGFNKLATYINEWAERKGWNDDDPQRYAYITKTVKHSDEDGDRLTTHDFIEAATVAHDISKLGLMMTELSEAIEGRRHGDPPSDKIPEYTSQEEELADCIVRIMHYAEQRNLRVAEALVAKMIYNENRPYKHGKQA